MCDSTSEDGIEARVDVIPFHESLLASGDGVVIPSLYVVIFEPLDSGWDGDLGITCGTSRCLARLAPGTLHCFFRAVQEAFGSIREKAATTCTRDHNVVGGVRPAPVSTRPNMSAITSWWAAVRCFSFQNTCKVFRCTTARLQTTEARSLTGTSYKSTTAGSRNLLVDQKLGCHARGWAFGRKLQQPAHATTM